VGIGSMKVALLLTGLARKVEEGYIHYWKHIIENYDVDVYLQFWEDEDYEKVLKIYNPVKYLQHKPFKFTEHRKGIESYFANGMTELDEVEDRSRPLVEYDVEGNFRGFPMFYSWQQGYNLIEGEYDCIIRSRYDLGTHRPIRLENLDLSKVNISNHHWGNSPVMDDNLTITNQKFADILFKDVFDEFITYAKSYGKIFFQEHNFTKILHRKGLGEHICKTNELPFDLLREMGLWYKKDKSDLK
jgi:hypothetical protein